MPTPRQQLVQISAWSYSRYQTYTQCPAKARYLYIDKLKEPDSAAGLKGTRIHAIAALVASGRLPEPNKDNGAFFAELQGMVKQRALPAELECFAEEFAGLKKTKGVEVEKEWAFTQAWEPTGWFAGDCWLRMKVDCYWLEQTKLKGGLRSTTVKIVDHKSGKMYDDHSQQKSLYALGAFLQFPDAKEVAVSHWYLEIGQETTETWISSQLPALKTEWLRKTTAMLNDKTYAPRPSEKCKWCAFSKAKGGPCQY